VHQHLLDGLAALVDVLAIHPFAVLREQRGVARVVVGILGGGVFDQHALDGELVFHALQALLDGGIGGRLRGGCRGGEQLGSQDQGAERCPGDEVSVFHCCILQSNQPRSSSS